jgi:hypothetical protein
MRAILVGLLVGFILSPMLLVGRPATALAAPAESCLPASRSPVTVLVRSGKGHPFEALESDDADPFVDVKAGRTVVPMRALFEALSPGVDSVRWYADLRIATFWYQGHTLSIRFGRDTDRTYSATLDGKVTSMTSYLCDGHVWVPVRAVSEALKVGVDYANGGLVMVDALGAATPDDAPKARSASACGPFPESLVSYLLSPSASARRAALAVACELRQY